MSSPDNHERTPPCHVVAIPYPGRGHINPMLNLCKALAGKSNHILITFIVTEEWLGIIGSMNKPQSISFAAIPNVLPSEHVRGEDVYGFAMAVLTKMQEPVEQLLGELQLQPPAFIIGDAFLPWTFEVAGTRNIPLAYHWPMSASVYSMFYHVDLLVQNGHLPVDVSRNGDAIVDCIPGLPPVRVADLPAIMKDQETTSLFLDIILKKSEGKCLVFASVYELESEVIDALKKKPELTIYNIGPASSYFRARDILTSTPSNHEDNADANTDDYSRWLDFQPHNSVLYISLGSFLSISRAQIEEIAAGLQQSGVRFLWVARGGTSWIQEICGEKGLMVPWCDQLRVLCHPSVGGFWSHCGWNSTKEAVLAGKPVLTFPIMMDQVPNAKAIVEDWRIGWRVTESEFDEEKLIKRGEISELVQRFMDLESPERMELVRNARELQNKIQREFADGQSFQTNLDGFTKSILQHTAGGH